MTQLEFRDGKREVPEHLALPMQRIETFRMTYEEALREVDRRRMADYINGYADRVVTSHMARIEGRLP
jgi:hypothetical protein